MLDLSFLLDMNLLWKVYVLSVFMYFLFGLMLVQNDQDTTYNRMPPPWTNHPKRWVAGALFGALFPLVNTILVGWFLRTMFDSKRAARLQREYLS